MPIDLGMDEERYEDISETGDAPDGARRSNPGHERASTTAVNGPDHAPSSIWEGLIGGHFSLVEQFERNGQVYLVARRNEPPGPQLTAREREVVARAARGLSNEEIAARTGLLQGAVEAHLANAAQKLGVGSRAALVSAAAAFCADDESA